MCVSIQPGNYAKLTAWNVALVFEAPVNYCEPEDSPESWLPWPEILSHNQTLKVREVSHSGEAIRFSHSPLDQMFVLVYGFPQICAFCASYLKYLFHPWANFMESHPFDHVVACRVFEECVSGTWYSLVGACPLESLYKKTETWIRIVFFGGVRVWSREVC